MGQGQLRVGRGGRDVCIATPFGLNVKTHLSVNEVVEFGGPGGPAKSQQNQLATNLVSQTCSAIVLDSWRTAFDVRHRMSCGEPKPSNGSA